MIDDSNSPFDVALARPFLDEPTRKKWSFSLPKPSAASWLSRSSSKSNKRLGGKNDHSDSSSKTEIITFESECDEDDSESRALLPSLPTPMATRPEVVGGNSSNDIFAQDNKSNGGYASSNSTKRLSSIENNLFFDIGYDERDDSNINGRICSSPTSVVETRSQYSGPLLVKAWCNPLQRELFEEQDPSDEDMELVPLTSTEAAMTSEVISLDIESGVSGDLESVAIDGDIAIMTERNTELTNIATSMRQIHTIQKDLATVVDTQGCDIQRMSWQSIEAFSHAQSGLEHLVKTVKTRENRKSRFYSVMASTVVVMAFCYIVAGFFASTQDDPDPAIIDNHGQNEQGGSPKFLIPITLLLP